MKISFRPKSLKDQVLVVTGASSGIGLVTARMAAQRGARVVLVSRDEPELVRLAHEIQHMGGQALAAPADVTKLVDLERARDKALNSFGRIDTWINNAGTSIFGGLMDSPLEEERELFDVNFWGVRNGCRVAVPALAERGGTLINIGSVNSLHASPLQGVYSASKHAVKGYTEALRVELDAAGLPVAVCLVLPASINTPFPQHARNELRQGAPSLIPPVYDPNLAASVILECAQSPRARAYVGGAARFIAGLEALSPWIADEFMKWTAFRAQTRGVRDLSRRNENLRHPPAENGRERGFAPRPVTHVLGVVGICAAVLFLAFRLQPRWSDR